MKWNAVVAVGAILAVALVGIVSLNGRNTQAADPPKPAAEVVGRYQLIHANNGGIVCLLDTVSGQLFQPEKPADKVGEWKEYIAPVKAK